MNRLNIDEETYNLLHKGSKIKYRDLASVVEPFSHTKPYEGIVKTILYGPNCRTYRDKHYDWWHIANRINSVELIDNHKLVLAQDIFEIDGKNIE